VIETIRLVRYIKHGSEDEKIKKISVTKKKVEETEMILVATV